MQQSRSFPPPPAVPSVGATTMPPLRSFASEHPVARSTLRSEETMLRPPPSRTQMMVLGSLVLALVVGAILLLVPHGGRAIVNVTDPRGAPVGRVDIYVDGHKQCDTSPCIVESLSTGSHDVKALAEGYDTSPVQTINVESHRDSLATIMLGGAAKGTGIKVSGTQPGVKLYVDDKEIGPLPQDYREMIPGDHVVRIIGSERYQPLERRITLERDRVEDLGSVTLKVLKGKATITLATPGARVYLVAGTDRRELPMLPISVDIDTTRTWSLQAIRPGYAEYNQPISFDDGQAEKTYVVTLEPRSAQPYAVGGGWAPVPGGGGGGGSAPPPYQPPMQAPPRSAPVPMSTPPAQVAAQPMGGGGGGGGEGFLNINSIPPSTVFLDGRQLGPTPKVHVSVSPGPHQVKFVNSEQNLQKTISVAVNAGETKLAVAKLSN
jgi:serine/threonine-protein kinase